MSIGYAWASTFDQNHDLQFEQPREAGCERIVTDEGAGDRDDRFGLTRLLREVLREGDTPFV